MQQVRRAAEDGPTLADVVGGVLSDVQEDLLVTNLVSELRDIARFLPLEHANKAADEIERLTAELEQLRTWHINGRANVEYKGSGIRICRGTHDKHEPCEWVDYTAAEPPAAQGYRAMPPTCGCYTWTNGLGESGEHVCEIHAQRTGP